MVTHLLPRCGIILNTEIPRLLSSVLKLTMMIGSGTREALDEDSEQLANLVSDLTRIHAFDAENVVMAIHGNARGFDKIFATLMDDRKEAQLDRAPVHPGMKLYDWALRRLREHVPEAGLPATGRLRFRVRLWGRKGVPIRGVVVRIQPRGSVRRRRHAPRPAPQQIQADSKACSACEALQEENRRLQRQLDQERAERRLLQRALSEAQREIERLRGTDEPTKEAENRQANPPQRTAPTRGSMEVSDDLSPSSPSLTAQRTSEGVIWYRKDQQVHRFGLQCDLMRMLMNPPREPRHPFDVGVALAASLLVGVPLYRRGHKEKDPLQGLEPDGIFRWIQHFLTWHRLVIPAPKIGSPSVATTGKDIPPSEARIGDVVFFGLLPWSKGPTHPALVLNESTLLGIPQWEKDYSPCVQLLPRGGETGQVKRIFTRRERRFDTEPGLHRSLWDWYRHQRRIRNIESLLLSEE